MHLRHRRALTLATVALFALAWGGCEAKKQTELVAGVSTQVRVPRDLKAVRVDVLVGGVVQFCRAYRVYDGKVQLPRSLGALPITDARTGEAITVSVRGFTEPFSETSSNPALNDCLGASALEDEKNGVRILRRSRQPYVRDAIVYLPMPLKYSCYDVHACDGDENKTCKAGRCVEATIDPANLPAFDPALVDGTGGGCFPAENCFKAASPAVQVDPSSCTFAIPNTPSAPPQIPGIPPNPFPSGGDGVNVMVVYDGGYTSEILDKSEVEGFSIPDAAKPQQFRLAPGLCDMLKGYDPEGNPTKHRITGVFASGTCQAKGPFQPMCAEDQLAAMGVDDSGVSLDPDAPDGCAPRELVPPNAVLMVLADDSQGSNSFYDEASTKTIGLSLADPAFSNADVGLTFFPGPATCATAGSFTPAVAPKLAREARTEIAAAFDALAANDKAGLKPQSVPVALDGALRDTYALLSSPQYDGYLRRAVLVLGNRELNTTSCGGPLPHDLVASAAASPAKIRTYAITLTSPTGKGPSDPVEGGPELAGADFADVRTSEANAKSAFQRIVNDLATCVYDVDTASLRPAAGDVLSYSDPVAHKTVTIGFDAACTAEGAAASGWGLDPSNPLRVHVCGAACTDYRNVLQTASLYAAQNLKPALPVPIFAHKAGCEPTPTK